MARKSQPIDGQGSLFDGRRAQAAPRAKTPRAETPRAEARERDAAAPRRWRMPAVEGKTVAEIRLRWPKRLTPAQVARVEAELGALPGALTKLGFGAVVVERTFVRRRKS